MLVFKIINHYNNKDVYYILISYYNLYYQILL